jgi:hypothetical protein
MAGAATDLGSHLAFLEAAEAHRYRLIQSLNRLHTFEVRAEDDAARSRDPLAERVLALQGLLGVMLADLGQPWRVLGRFHW